MSRVATPPEAGSWREPEAAPSLPQRYRVRRGDRDDYLSCEEAPRIRVHLQREFAFSETAARELGGRVILLDGAGSFAPVLDHKRRFYNLDHHQGCERTFTLATCEQALLLVRSGLDLAEGDWSIYANEPDLDTVLAIWCLLNHARLRDLRPEACDVLFPMIRLEGAIDANGNELAEACGLPSAVREEARIRLDGLMERELQVKSGGKWQSMDLGVYTAEMLGAVDRVVYSVEDFRDYASIEEIHGHTEIGERSVAVACHDGAGIYAVEKLLKERWGDQLGLIALEKEPRQYTLRRASTLSDIDLNDAYDLLNLLDRNVDGHPGNKRWGGSAAIGGSPRPTGSALNPSQLLEVLARALRPPRRWHRLRAVARAGLAVAGLGAVGFVAGLGAATIPGVAGNVDEETAYLAIFSFFIASASWLLSALCSGQRLWLYGFRRPAGLDWLPLFFVAALAALPMRVWFPSPGSLDPGALVSTAGVVALAAIAVESWFRGLVHGLLLLDFKVRTGPGPWRISGAVAVSAALYACAAGVLCLPAVWLEPSPWLSPAREAGLVVGAAALAGLALGVMRERSLSLWPGVLAQVLGGLGCAALGVWLRG